MPVATLGSLADVTVGLLVSLLLATLVDTPRLYLEARCLWIDVDGSMDRSMLEVVVSPDSASCFVAPFWFRRFGRSDDDTIGATLSAASSAALALTVPLVSFLVMASRK